MKLSVSVIFFFIHSPRELKKKPQLKRQMSVSSLILTWCKDVTQDYEVTNACDT